MHRQTASLPKCTRHLSIEERFWLRVEKTETCWLWTGSRNANGYGKFKHVPGGSPLGVHRFAYELLVGPIPHGLEIDHLCRVRNCVNPAHLEPVTGRENKLRANAINVRHAAKTHCVHGHPFDAVNTYWRPTGGRACRTCRRGAYQRHVASKGRA